MDKKRKELVFFLHLPWSCCCFVLVGQSQCHIKKKKSENFNLKIALKTYPILLPRIYVYGKPKLTLFDCLVLIIFFLLTLFSIIYMFWGVSKRSNSFCIFTWKLIYFVSMATFQNLSLNHIMAFLSSSTVLIYFKFFFNFLFRCLMCIHFSTNQKLTMISNRWVHSEQETFTFELHNSDWVFIFRKTKTDGSETINTFNSGTPFFPQFDICLQCCKCFNVQYSNNWISLFLFSCIPIEHICSLIKYLLADWIVALFNFDFCFIYSRAFFLVDKYPPYPSYTHLVCHVRLKTDENVQVSIIVHIIIPPTPTLVYWN
jgi:hypothetical protein